MGVRDLYVSASNGSFDGAGGPVCSGRGGQVAAPWGPIYGCNCNSDSGGSSVTDNSGGNWAGCQVGDYLCWDYDGSPSRCLITSISGAVATVQPGVNPSQVEIPCTVGGAVDTLSAIAAATLAALANGDWLRINVQSGTYAETLTIANTTDSITRPVLWLGFETTPFLSSGGVTTQIGDGCPNGSRPIITGGGARAYCLTSSLSSIYSLFSHLRLTGATSHNVSGSSTSYWLFDDCVSDGSGGCGFVTRDYSIMRRCVGHGNAMYGFNAGTNNVLHDCEAYDNVGRQIQLGVNAVARTCRVHGIPAGGYGIYLSGVAGMAHVLNCTIDGAAVANGSTGIGSTSALFVEIVDAIITHCAYPVALGGDKSLWCFASRNNIYNYTSLTNFANHFDPTYVDPQFVDAANHDYSLHRNSPLIGIGSGGGDIGAMQSRQGILVPGGLS